MTDKQIKKKKPGRPPVDNPATETLGRVRVTQDQIDEYSKAAEKKNKTLSQWVRDTLDKAVKSIR